MEKRCCATMSMLNISCGFGTLFSRKQDRAGESYGRATSKFESGIQEVRKQVLGKQGGNQESQSLSVIEQRLFKRRQISSCHFVCTAVRFLSLIPICCSARTLLMVLQDIKLHFFLFFPSLHWFLPSSTLPFIQCCALPGLCPVKFPSQLGCLTAEQLRRVLGIFANPPRQQRKGPHTTCAISLAVARAALCFQTARMGS